MAKKVKLDILKARQEDKATGDAGSPSPPEEASDGRQNPKGRSYKRWIVPCMIVTGLCLAAGGAFFIWTMIGHGDSASTALNRPPVAVSTPPRSVVNFENFVIDYRQQNGDFRIVMFALTVEFNRPVDGDAIRYKVDLREAIYELSRRKSVTSLIAPDQRGTFKEEIAAEVEKRVGAGMVKGVYFTKFSVL